MIWINEWLLELAESCFFWVGSKSRYLWEGMRVMRAQVILIWGGLGVRFGCLSECFCSSEFWNGLILRCNISSHKNLCNEILYALDRNHN